MAWVWEGDLDMNDHCQACGSVFWANSVRESVEDASGTYQRCSVCHFANAPRNPDAKPWLDEVQKATLKERQADDQPRLL